MRTFTLITILLLSTSLTFSQVNITGNVSDGQTNEPLPGVTILIKGSTQGTATDVQGNFSVNASSNDVLVFSSMGYTTMEIPVGNRTAIEVSLTPDLVSLDEIVVVGFGTQKKSVVTGSISKIDATNLAGAKDLRIEQALQGRAAGVTIMNNSGQPGDNLTIRIRGTGTNGNPDPLFIIDGLPMEKYGLDYLNPSDVESIEVLKDAASAAIYGTRGANGVVIITTKQGRKNQPISVTYDGSYGVQNPTRKLDLLNAQQYIQIMNEAHANDGRTSPLFDEATVNNILANGWDTDWQNELYFRNAPKQSHTFSLNGGGDNSTYSSSLSYFTQDGIVAQGKSNFERFTYRLNTTRSFGKLLIGSNVNLVDIKTFGIDGNNQYGLGLIQAINMPPIVPIRNNDGTWGTPSDFGVGLQEITNPVAMLEYHNSKSRTNKALGNFYAEFEIIPSLKVRSNYGAEYAFVHTNSYTPVYYIDATHQNDSLNAASTGITNYTRWNWDNTVTFSKTFNLHSLGALAGITFFKAYNEGVWAMRRDLIFDDFDYAFLSNSQNPVAQASGGYSEHTLASYFGRINYNYDEKYLLEAVLRADGSSRFGPDNRYGYFPAFSAGWVITREGFFPSNPVLNFAKIRGSWGQNGNENIDGLAFTSALNTNLIYFFGPDATMVHGMQPRRYANTAIKWETSEQLSIGADMAFFNNRLTLTLDYYDKRTKDWLFSGASFPLLIGNVDPMINGGQVRNSGYEMELGYKNRFRNDLSVNLSFTGSTNRSEMVEIANEEGVLSGGTGIHGQGGILRAEVGMPLGYFYGLQTNGIFQSQDEVTAHINSEGRVIQPRAKPGDLRFVDTDGSGSIDDADRVYLGNPYPKFMLGANINLEWKGFDLFMFWYSALGHQIWMANRRSDLKYTNFTTDILNRWTVDNPNNDMPRVTFSDPNRSWMLPSDFYVKDADFLRLKTLSVGYTLPSKLTERVNIGRLRVYFTSENLLTYTKYPGMEVEVGGGPFSIGIDHGVYPHARTFITGIQIGF